MPGGDPLTVDATFHNTLDTDITDSFIVAVGIRLAPPAPRLTSDQVTVEWFDAGPSVWRPVQLTPGDTALSGYLSTDAGLPSVGSLPAGDSARIPLRVSLASGVPAPTTLQFVTQGLIQPTASVDPAALMDGKASYPWSSRRRRRRRTRPRRASRRAVRRVTRRHRPTPRPPRPPPLPARHHPRPVSAVRRHRRDGFADTGTSAPVVAGSVAALVFAAVVAVGVTWRRRRGRR
ncbi:hypothetical protein O1M54_08860 [Streptomyces diastatochromogenes]|nr:hypothetical protein [Streptomyces diastatochromogenes]